MGVVTLLALLHAVRSACNGFADVIEDEFEEESVNEEEENF